MKPVLTAAVLSLALAATAMAGGSTDCLSTERPMDCLADRANEFAQSEKSATLRAEGYESLLLALSKAGIRKDGVFNDSAGAEVEDASTRWRLGVARRVYALNFLQDDSNLASVNRSYATAVAIKEHEKGFERLAIIWTACEAREATPRSKMARWEGALDRLCSLSRSDAEALDEEIPSLAIIAAPMIDAYNRNLDAMKRSMAISNELLSEYGILLDKASTDDGRTAIRLLIAIGHALNASAFALVDMPDEAAKEVKAATDSLAKLPMTGKDPTLDLINSYLSWAMAKAGMHAQAMGEVRTILSNVDSNNDMDSGDKALALAECIEILDAVRTGK